MKKSASVMSKGMEINSTYSQLSLKTSMIMTLNPKDKIPEHVLMRITKEADTLIECLDFCKRVWEEIKKCTLNQDGIMNASNFNIIYEKFKDRIYELFGILTAKELFQILDEDNDGFMNEDEQVLFFSIIKTKMLRCAQELLVIFDYKRFYELMKCVRQLEKNINSYQDTLRQNIYNNELIKYKEVGRDKLDEFFDKYERKFEEFEVVKAERKREMEMKRQAERAEYEKQISSDQALVKFKPKGELKEYLKNERLVALEERIEEATNFRKELEKFSTKETNRINNEIAFVTEKKLKAFDFQSEKLMIHLNVKIDNDENKLKIRMAKEFDILLKKIALHENDIKRIQTQSKKAALLKGERDGELMRLKKTLRKQNEIIQKSKRKDMETNLLANKDDSRSLNATGGLSPTLNNAESEGKFNKLPSIGVPERVKNAYKKLETLKQAPDLIRFYIKQKFRDDIPWNSKLESYQTGDDQHHKIEKYLKGRSKGTNEGINIARLYNDNLEEVDNFKSSLKALTNQMMSQKHEQRQKITEMLNVKSKVKS